MRAESVPAYGMTKTGAVPELSVDFSMTVLPIYIGNDETHGKYRCMYRKYSS